MYPSARMSGLFAIVTGSFVKTLFPLSIPLEGRGLLTGVE